MIVKGATEWQTLYANESHGLCKATSKVVGMAASKAASKAARKVASKAASKA